MKTRLTYLIIGLALAAGSLRAEQLIVTSAADAGAGSLRAAIDSAAAGDTVLLDASLAGSVINLSSGFLHLEQNIMLVGLGGSVSAINANSLSRVFTVDSGVTASLRGFTLALGQASGSGMDANGGGVFNAGTLILDDVKILGGRADSLGGGIYSTGIVTASKTVVKNGSAFHGGGIYIASGTLSLFDTKVEDNDAARGAGMWLNGSSAIMTAGLVNRNDATGDGGAVYAANGSITISRVTMDGNSSGGNGGAIYVASSLVTNRSTYANNSAVGNGGAVFTTSTGDISAENVTWSGNDAGGTGGAIHAGDQILVRANTLTNNYASVDGGAIFLSTAVSLKLLENSIISGNTAASVADDVANNSGLFSSKYNLYGVIDDGSFSPGTGDLVGVDANLDILADNGGDSRTHALLCGSAAINAANPALSLVLDQRSLPRGVDGRSDIGAFELQDTCPSAVVCIVDSVVLGTQSACDSGTDTYSQEVIVYATDAPATGSLSVNGVLFAVAADTVTLTGLAADGNAVDLDVFYTDDTLCSFSQLSAWTAPVSCAPVPCAIDSVVLGTQSACDPGTDTYSQEVIVYATSAPATGDLSVNGVLFSAAADTVLLSGLASDGNAVDLDVFFTDDSLCAYSQLAAWTAPVSCAPIPCAIDSVVLGAQSACDGVSDTYSQEVIVYATSAPATGDLSVNGVLFSAAADTVLLSGLPADGAPVDLSVLFTADSACAFTLDSAWTAPASCYDCTAQTPTDLVATFVSANGNMELNWSPVPASQACQVSGRPLGAPGFANVRRTGFEVSTITVPSGKLVSGTSYEWFVTCACAVPPGPSDLTNPSVLDTFDYDSGAVTCDAATDPDMLTSTFQPSDSSMVLTWNPPIGMINCRVNIRPFGAPIFALRSVDGNPPTTDTIPADGLVPGTSYEWKVKCSCNVPPGPGESTDFSTLDTFLYPALRRAAPLSLEGMSIFPNPANNNVVIRSEQPIDGKYTVEMRDAKGRMVAAWSDRAQAGVPFQRNFDISRVAPGSYWIRVVHADGVWTEQLQIVD